MTEGRDAPRRQVRTPLRQRSRRRWGIAGGVAAFWVVMWVFTGSAISATVLLVVIGTLGAASVGGLRALGITRDHPWIQRLASRPWRDGQDVLKIAMRHLSDVFVVTPSGSLLAPSLVELQLNPDDLACLCERMELGVISESMTEVYEEQVAAYRARYAGPGRAEVYVTASESIPPGRYRLRQGDPVSAAAPAGIYAEAAPELAYAAPHGAYADSGGNAWHDSGPAAPPSYGWPAPGPAGPTVAAGMTTLMEPNLPPVPALRLVTGSSIAETRMSGARAGRGSVELVLPEDPTVSREHATFTFAEGRWRITNLGRNGLAVNGVPVDGEQPLSDGDSIRWGSRPDALLSRIEIS